MRLITISDSDSGVLRQPCQAVSREPNVLFEGIDHKSLFWPTEKFVSEMAELMYESGGVGLAAQQVGLVLPFFIMDPSFGMSSDEFVFVGNPSILHMSEECDLSIEGCLSLPGKEVPVKRSRAVDVVFTTLTGERVQKRLEGISAVIFQHEFDHLCGVLITERASRQKIVTGYQKPRKK